jgi:DNA-binding NarL/FixJ family response regulator
VGNRSHGSTTLPGGMTELTPRELEVVAILGHGATNREIAAAMFISEKTASVHVTNILRKLGVSNRNQVVAIAHREGLVDR